MGSPAEDPVVEKLTHTIEDLARHMEKMKIAEYVRLLENPRRLFLLNFAAGVARGVGIALGGTLVAAAVLYALRRVIVLNLPVIGDFVAQLVIIVQQYLRG